MNKAITVLGRTLVTLVCLTTLAPIYAQQSDSFFARSDTMIPMRDGVRLYTQVYTPTQVAERLPILLLRTPYGIGDLSSAQLASAIPELAADRYVVVRQDIRGRFKSEGQFVMLRQPRDPTDKQAIDEWVLKDLYNQRNQFLYRQCSRYNKGERSARQFFHHLSHGTCLHIS